MSEFTKCPFCGSDQEAVTGQTWITCCKSRADEVAAERAADKAAATSDPKRPQRNGGPAFPQHGWSKDPEVVKRMQDKQGMSLLDVFAVQAMHQLIAIKAEQTLGELARESYDIAQAMVLESQRRNR